MVFNDQSPSYELEKIILLELATSTQEDYQEYLSRHESLRTTTCMWSIQIQSAFCLKLLFTQPSKDYDFNESDPTQSCSHYSINDNLANTRWRKFKMESDPIRAAVRSRCGINYRVEIGQRNKFLPLPEASSYKESSRRLPNIQKLS